MFGELKAKLATLEAKLRLLLTTLESQAKLYEGDAKTIDAEALGVLAGADATIKKVEAQGVQKMGAARAMLKKIIPPA
jgi:hypothetical protein